LSAIFSLSQFAIRWARFAWNPNSTPFWTLLALYALHELVIKKDNRKFLWAVLAGLAVGIGVQLHTMLLLSFPITLIIVFVYLLIKKNAIWKYFLVIFAVAFFLNIPQVVHEYATNGSNIQAFFGGIKTKEDNQHSIMENLVQGNSSVAQIVPDILTGYEISDNFKLTFDGNHNNDVAVAILGALFTLGGAILAIKYYKKEENVERKAFLAILFVYTVVSYLIFIKLAFTISVRMYLVLFFVPFFLLGFWLRFLSEKLGKYWNNVLITISIFFILSNLFFIKQYFEDFASYYAGLGTVDIATLGGMEKFANFITSTSKGNSTAYVSGDKKFLFVSSRSISYLIERSNISLSMVGSNEIVSSSITKFYYIARENKLDNFNDDPNYKITKQETYGKFSIMMLEKK
jgi:4-amino-4-deoxy-L-arabinose transferase-like glycosyltransferase